MNYQPRIAFFADSFHEVNGVANTSRRFVHFARKLGLPMLSIRAGEQTTCLDDGSVRSLDLRRGPVSFAIDRDQRFDLLIWRYVQLVSEHLRRFQPDLVHITGPSDIGQVGAYVAHKLGIPLVASWHTNLHDFAERRINKLVGFLPDEPRLAICELTRTYVLKAVLRFYRIPRILLAPNDELAAQLARTTGKPTYLMRRGVDTNLFNPTRRNVRDKLFRLGYVGRLTPEKDVRLLAGIEKRLEQMGKSGFKFLIVGDGSERSWLERNLKHAEFTGVLTGERLASAYASIDAFVFPSRSDTFGNVVLEAAASGAPAIVTDQGGPRFLVSHGVTGYVAASLDEFVDAAVALMSDPELRTRMSIEARKHAMEASWDAVFNRVYDAYLEYLGANKKEAAAA
jgi:phosphatidylinositol alpha 1,6-mannosyltransferase